MTSAYLALQLYLGEFEHIVVPFDQIFDAVKSGNADAGLIIHEGQLTYERSGFRKIVDLGEWWKRETGLPLPLGGNVLRKDIPPRCSAICCRSCAKASTSVSPIETKRCGTRCLMRATWMPISPGKFIGMYVNDYTRDYGETGRKAIRRISRTMPTERATSTRSPRLTFAE